MARSEEHFAVVALPLPFKFHTGGFSGLTYSIPEELAARALPGVRVLVPLGKRFTTGVLVSLSAELPAEVKKLKPIADILDPAPVFDQHFLEWTKWIAAYYLCSWGEVLETALPQGLRPETKSKVSVVSQDVTGDINDLRRRAPKRAEVLKAIASYPHGVYLSHLEKRDKLRGVYGQSFALEQEGYVRIEHPVSGLTKPKKQRVVLLSEELEEDTASFSAALMELERAQKQAGVLLRLHQQRQLHPDEPLPVRILEKQAGVTNAVINALKLRGFIRYEEREITPIVHALEEIGDHDITNISLTADQEEAVKNISASLEAKQAATFLIHGITGSGKTEVYISLAKKVLDRGGGVLILVPEISLTPQLIERFERRLSAGRNMNIAVLHSRMPLAERYRSWKMLASGETQICIGARSAVFAPIKDLGLIVVDEEHEVTYKQYDSTPRYNARDAAVMRTHLLGSICVLGSATPSFESYYNAEQGKYKLLKLTKRAQEAVLPEVRIADMRSAPRRKEQLAQMTPLSDELIAKIQERIARKEGTVLLQNRRGFATYIGCSNCGEVIMCPNCAVTLTYHATSDRLHCHYCGYISQKPQVCPTCGSAKLYQGGTGTQRVEDELLKVLPDARVIRMDLDTTARKGAYEKILHSFASGESDILLGTQMVAKGLDFPRVTLVGVISADTSLALPDFRSSERTFQLMTQVSGRAGRKDLAGEVIVQTMQPEHVAILRAREHDYEGFYAHEMPLRKELNYPPYSRLVLIEFKGKKEETVREHAFAFAQLFPAKSSYYERIGPAEPVLKKLRGEYRWHILVKDDRIKDPSGEKLRRTISGALELYQKRFASVAVKVTVDVDVQGVL